ncbi:hypothetical protein [Luteolibacter luteus]|uniref:Uncharacterized protein n=1 Tax=Luteolibacter luteus TaxID=2728835 RepID=A0A858RT01_9BACT|nr:hypothetical protein [Luteolibacter luteus]QJE99133.1 hypothetical protein HHL09_26250 [Luteolibacter luteus]
MNEETLKQATAVDALLAMMVEQPPADIRARHLFTPGLYTRGCRIPRHTLLVTEQHLTEHPFIITEGTAWVWSENEGVVIYQAPHIGVTKPGTRRVIWTETEVMWTTFHATEETDVEQIGRTILAEVENPLLPDGHPGLHAWLGQLPVKTEDLKATNGRLEADES